MLLSSKLILKKILNLFRLSRKRQSVLRFIKFHKSSFIWSLLQSDANSAFDLNVQKSKYNLFQNLTSKTNFISLNSLWFLKLVRPKNNFEKRLRVVAKIHSGRFSKLSSKKGFYWLWTSYCWSEFENLWQ